MVNAPDDATELERLARAGAAGDSDACKALIERLWPLWMGIARTSKSLRALGATDDNVREVATRMAEKIGRSAGRGLRLYPPWREQNPEKSFLDWIRIVTANVIRDYVRERVPRRDDGTPSVKRFLNELSSSRALQELGVRPPYTAAQTVREILSFAKEALPEEQARALGLWLEGSGFSEIGREMSLDASGATNLVRAAVATLRRRFGV